MCKLIICFYNIVILIINIKTNFTLNSTYAIEFTINFKKYEINYSPLILQPL